MYKPAGRSRLMAFVAVSTLVATQLAMAPTQVEATGCTTSWAKEWTSDTWDNPKNWTAGVPGANDVACIFENPPDVIPPDPIYVTADAATGVLMSERRLVITKGSFMAFMDPTMPSTMTGITQRNGHVGGPATIVTTTLDWSNGSQGLPETRTGTGPGRTIVTDNLTVDAYQGGIGVNYGHVLELAAGASGQWAGFLEIDGDSHLAVSGALTVSPEKRSGTLDSGVVHVQPAGRLTVPKDADWSSRLVNDGNVTVAAYAEAEFGNVGPYNPNPPLVSQGNWTIEGAGLFTDVIVGGSGEMTGTGTVGFNSGDIHGVYDVHRTDLDVDQPGELTIHPSAKASTTHLDLHAGFLEGTGEFRVTNLIANGGIIRGDGMTVIAHDLVFGPQTTIVGEGPGETTLRVELFGSALARDGHLQLNGGDRFEIAGTMTISDLTTSGPGLLQVLRSGHLSVEPDPTTTFLRGSLRGTNLRVDGHMAVAESDVVMARTVVAGDGQRPATGVVLDIEDTATLTSGWLEVDDAALISDGVVRSSSFAARHGSTLEMSGRIEGSLRLEDATMEIGRTSGTPNPIAALAITGGLTLDPATTLRVDMAYPVSADLISTGARITSVGTIEARPIGWFPVGAQMSAPIITHPSTTFGLLTIAEVPGHDVSYDRSLTETRLVLDDRLVCNQRPVDLGYDPFYTKHCVAMGMDILGSAAVDETAVVEVAEIVVAMLEHRVDLVATLAGRGTAFAVMDDTEMISDMPETRDIYSESPGTDWDETRGYFDEGVPPDKPFGLVAEENVLCHAGDRYAGEAVTVHEIAHAVMDVALTMIEPLTLAGIEVGYQLAMSSGLWANTNAANNAGEYWAHTTQVYFDAAFEGPAGGDGKSNDINTRAELLTYDPFIFATIDQVFGGHQPLNLCN